MRDHRTSVKCNKSYASHGQQYDSTQRILVTAESSVFSFRCSKQEN